MCFTRKRVQQIEKKYKKNAKVYPEPIYSSNEGILCHGCKKCFTLESEEIKINCAGCDRFFHCCIAGKCVGPHCKNQATTLGTVHQLSWCIYCVPGLPQNKVGGQTCICLECHKSMDQDSK